MDMPTMEEIARKIAEDERREDFVKALRVIAEYCNAPEMADFLPPLISEYMKETGCKASDIVLLVEPEMSFRGGNRLFLSHR